jgi:hypothetical protein
LFEEVLLFMPYADAVMGLQALPDAMAVFGYVRLCSSLL